MNLFGLNTISIFLIFVIWAPRASYGETVKYCLPASVLASQADYGQQRSKAGSVAQIGHLLEERLGTSEALDSLVAQMELEATGTGVAAFEARCWLARTGLSTTDRDLWMMIGPLRLESTGVRSWIWAAQQPNGLDRLVRLPRSGNWGSFADALAVSAFSNLQPDDGKNGPSPDALNLATERWKDLAPSGSRR